MTWISDLEMEEAGLRAFVKDPAGILSPRWAPVQFLCRLENETEEEKEDQ